ncbi:MAG: hypothetical protein Q8L92_15075, partial [Rubrivivax sp.]|nr:hypothetical protein [Rubrivivax sp.]
MVFGVRLTAVVFTRSARCDGYAGRMRGRNHDPWVPQDRPAAAWGEMRLAPGMNCSSRLSPSFINKNPFVYYGYFF